MQPFSGSGCGVAIRSVPSYAINIWVCSRRAEPPLVLPLTSSSCATQLVLSEEEGSPLVPAKSCPKKIVGGRGHLQRTGYATADPPHVPTSPAGSSGVENRLVSFYSHEIDLPPFGTPQPLDKRRLAARIEIHLL